MGALTEDRLIPEREGVLIVLGCAAAKEFFAGALICKSVAGFALPGEAAVNLVAVGRCEEYVDNRLGANGAETVKVKRGVFRYDNSAGADAIAAADVESACYIVDDQTVARTSAGGARSVAGRIVAVEDSGVWVELGYGRLPALELGIPSFVIGAETGGNTINVAIQLKDTAGADLSQRASVLAYLATESHGDVITAAAPSGGVAVGLDGLAIPHVAGKAFQLISEVDGDIDLNIVEAGAATWYLVLVLPDGRLAVSGAITFAA